MLLKKKYHFSSKILFSDYSFLRVFENCYSSVPISLEIILFSFKFSLISKNPSKIWQAPIKSDKKFKYIQRIPEKS